MTIPNIFFKKGRYIGKIVDNGVVDRVKRDIWYYKIMKK